MVSKFAFSRYQKLKIFSPRRGGASGRRGHAPQGRRGQDFTVAHVFVPLYGDRPRLLAVWHAQAPLRAPMSRWHRVAPSRSTLAGIMDQRSAGGPREQGASAWHRTIIVEVNHFAPPVTGAITVASLTTETTSAAHAARLRRVVTKRHALQTINRGSCSAQENLPPASLCRTSAPCRMALI